MVAIGVTVSCVLLMFPVGLVAGSGLTVRSMIKVVTVYARRFKGPRKEEKKSILVHLQRSTLEYIYSGSKPVRGAGGQGYWKRDGERTTLR